jgi:hypothetical protein
LAKWHRSVRDYGAAKCSGVWYSWLAASTWRYGGWMASLHSSAWKEIEAMVRRTSKGLTIDLRPAIESLGLGQVIEQVGTKRVIEEIGSKRFIEEIGSKRLFEEIDLEDLLANLSPAKRRELKRRLQ